MITGSENLFALPAVEPLLREELGRVSAFAARQPVGRALLLQACAANRTLGTDARHLGVTRVHTDGDGMGGDVICANDALPWEDEAFRLIVVQHLGDVLPAPDALADELARVLAPGGMLLWFGLNAWSPWTLWLRWHARSGLPLPRSHQAETVRRRLLQGQLTPAAAEALGPCWPARADSGRGSPLLGPLRGAWMVAASKQRAVLTPLRPRPLRGRATPHPSLAVPSRRVRE